MPKLGLTMTEGTLSSWRVKPGDGVRTGDILFVVETEKVASEVEATADGRIDELLAAEGDIVPVGGAVATWHGLEIAASPPLGAPGNSSRQAERRLATPLARRLAGNLAIDLDSVPGSGPHGHIRARDVEVAAKLRSSNSQKTSEPGVGRRSATPAEKLIARRLSDAKQQIPHFYVMADADIAAVLALRDELRSDWREARITLTHFIVAAVGRALVDMPEIEEVWAEEEIVTRATAGVGIVVDTPRGPIVPVLRGAGFQPLESLAAQANQLINRAREGHLSADELEGGATAVSNVGMHGAASLIPIVNPGQSSILGVGCARGVFRPDTAGMPVLCQELSLVLSCDHRVLDGVKAARFLGRIADILAHPRRLLRA